MLELGETTQKKLSDSLVNDDIDPGLAEHIPKGPDRLFDAAKIVQPNEPKVTMKEADDYTPSSYDKYISAEATQWVGYDTSQR